jgi:hypothetical protein
MKNTHIEHPEDSILNGDLSVLDWFTARGHLSVKIDGAPAIVWGIDPATDTFFVGTKVSFQQKETASIAHSHDEIDQHYEGILLQRFFIRCLPEVSAPCEMRIIQGDFIGFGGD